MKALISNTLIKKIKPKEKQYDIRDSKLIGFLIRVNPTGNMNYVCEYTRGKRINIGKVNLLTPTQAREKAIQILAEASNGNLPSTTSPKNTNHQNITYQDFVENHYEPWFREHRRSLKSTMDHLKLIFYKPFANTPLIDISPLKIDKWRTEKLKGKCSPNSVNSYVTSLKAAISKAVEWEMIERNPLIKLKALKTDKNPIVRFLSPEEECQLIEALVMRDDKMKLDRSSGNRWRHERNYPFLPDISENSYADYLTPMVLLSLNTGIRKGELFSLKWSSINFEKKSIMIEGSNSKNGSTRHLPLNSKALSVLKVWHSHNSDQMYVFVDKSQKPVQSVRKAWLNVLKASDITGFRWHDMRHHFASKLVMAGVDLNTVRELLGHSDIKMTLRYAHLAPEHKARAVEKLVVSTESR